MRWDARLLKLRRFDIADVIVEQPETLSLQPCLMATFNTHRGPNWFLEQRIQTLLSIILLGFDLKTKRVVMYLYIYIYFKRNAFSPLWTVATWGKPPEKIVSNSCRHWKTPRGEMVIWFWSVRVICLALLGRSLMYCLHIHEYRYMHTYIRM